MSKPTTIRIPDLPARCAAAGIPQGAKNPMGDAAPRGAARGVARQIRAPSRAHRAAPLDPEARGP